MFHAAQALLLGEGLSFSKHSAVIAAFGQHFTRTGRMAAHLHRHLLKGMDTRQLADYATTPISAEESAEQLHRAEEFIRAAEALLTSDEPPSS